MQFASDNSGPAHPRVIEAITRANEGYALPYGAEAAMERVRDRIRTLFGAPEAAVYLVATGTACNALLLTSMTRPWETVFCSEVAHIQEDECGAPEFYSGAKLSLVEAPDALMTPETLRARIEETSHGVVHGVQRGPVSITTVSERGTVYALDRLQELTEVAREFGLPVHLDGARFANAQAALGCGTADLVAGMDAVSFGATKNGCLGVEAAVIRDPERAWEFELRRKRAGHLFSKHRFLTAQMEAYLTDDLWLEMARAANRAASRLSRGLAGIDGVEVLHPPEANMVFAAFPRGLHAKLRAAGARFYTKGAPDGPEDTPLTARMVCDWSASDANTDRFLEIIAAG